MPQLDSLSWFDQVFSTLMVFFTFYLLLSLIFLPALTSIIKGRYKVQGFRKYIIQFFGVQMNLLVQDTKNYLALLFTNNLFLINSYYMPVFSTQLQDSLSTFCYDSVDNNEMVYLQTLFANKAQINFLQQAEALDQE